MCLPEKRKALCKVQKLSQQQMSDGFSKKKKNNVQKCWGNQTRDVFGGKRICLIKYKEML